MCYIFRNVVKAFYTAGFLMDVLTTFGEQTEEVQQNCKYAKWKAAYIHNCLRNGETPVPGPLGGEEQGSEGGPSTSGQPQPSIGEKFTNFWWCGQENCPRGLPPFLGSVY